MSISTSYKNWLKGAMAIVIVLFSSCYQAIPVETPLLSEEELIPILKDIHLAEAVLTEVMNKQEKDSLARLYYAQIFALHEVDTAKFDQTMNAYMTDPPALDSLYEAVIQALSEEKKAATAKKEEPKSPDN
ncbi:MAG: DUF4296 domain-containing protein [Aureispira sp.]